MPTSAEVGFFMNMTPEQEELIERDLKDQIGWLKDGKVQGLSVYIIDTIMAILRVRLNKPKDGDTHD